MGLGRFFPVQLLEHAPLAHSPMRIRRTRSALRCVGKRRLALIVRVRSTAYAAMNPPFFSWSGPIDSSR